MSFRCAVDLVGRLYKKFAGILTYSKNLLCKMTAEDVVQMGGRGFLEVSLNQITAPVIDCVFDIYHIGDLSAAVIDLNLRAIYARLLFGVMF